MPYYSYGYGYDSANTVYLILVPVLLLSLYAQVSRNTAADSTD